MPEAWDALIIGAGHNGLVTAAVLARAGLRVLVLERRPRVGGASVTEEIFPGFRISTAAYLCSLFPERLVRALDLPRYGYHVYPKDPTFFTPFPDGRSLLFWQDQRRTCEEIAKFSRRDAAAYPVYEAHLESLAQWMERLLWRRPPNLARMTAGDVWRAGRFGWDVLRLDEASRIELWRMLTQSASDLLDSWFESEEVKVTLATDGVIGTAGGPRTPGTAYVLLHHVMGQVNGRRGVWGFVRGGMGALSEAIAAAARAAGATIRTEADVRQILVREGRAVGVVLAEGEEIRARVLVSNADPKRTFLTLVGESALDPEFVRQVRAIRMSGYVMKINLVLDALPSFRAIPGERLQPHHRTTIHICPDRDYVERAWDEAKYGRPSSAPMLEITIPTTYDDSLAPPGKHIMGIFVQYAPYHLRDGDWRTLKEAYADHVMRLLEDYAPGFMARVRARHVLSPQDLEEEFGLTGGNIFHGDMSPDQLFAFRPVPGWAHSRTPIRGLYLCGAGTHPGGGVMGIPGYHAARAILHDWRWRRL